MVEFHRLQLHYTLRIHAIRTPFAARSRLSGHCKGLSQDYKFSKQAAKCVFVANFER